MWVRKWRIGNTEQNFHLLMTFIRHKGPILYYTRGGGPWIFYPKFRYLGTIWPPKGVEIHPAPFQTKRICLNFLRDSCLNLQYIMFGYDVSSCLFLNALWDSLLKICGKVYLQWEHPLDSILRQQKINPSRIIFFFFVILYPWVSLFLHFWYL